jgi:hypothetical protein
VVCLVLMMTTMHCLEAVRPPPSPNQSQQRHLPTNHRWAEAFLVQDQTTRTVRAMEASVVVVARLLPVPISQREEDSSVRVDLMRRVRMTGASLVVAPLLPSQRPPGRPNPNPSQQRIHWVGVCLAAGQMRTVKAMMVEVHSEVALRPNPNPSLLPRSHLSSLLWEVGSLVVDPIPKTRVMTAVPCLGHPPANPSQHQSLCQREWTR